MHEDVLSYMNCFKWSNLHIRFWVSLGPCVSLMSIKQMNQEKSTFTWNQEKKNKVLKDMLHQGEFFK